MYKLATLFATLCLLTGAATVQAAADKADVNTNHDVIGAPGIIPHQERQGDGRPLELHALPCAEHARRNRLRRQVRPGENTVFPHRKAAESPHSPAAFFPFRF